MKRKNISSKVLLCFIIFLSIILSAGKVNAQTYTYQISEGLIGSIKEKILTLADTRLLGNASGSALAPLPNFANYAWYRTPINPPETYGNVTYPKNDVYVCFSRHRYNSPAYKFFYCRYDGYAHAVSFEHENNTNISFGKIGEVAETLSPNVKIGYMMAFYSSGDIRVNEVQEAIWDYIDYGDGVANNIYSANNAYNEYRYNSSFGYGGTFTFVNNNANANLLSDYVAVGPFKTQGGDFCENSYITNYSGQKLPDGTKNILGGVVGGEIILDNTTFDIGSLSSNSNVFISANASQANASGLVNGKYPGKNSTFYIYIKKSVAQNYKKLTKLTLNYRVTDCDACYYTTTYYKNKVGEGSPDNPVRTDINELIWPINATVTVTDTPYNLNLNIPLYNADISINKYISAVNGNSTLSEYRRNAGGQMQVWTNTAR